MRFISREIQDSGATDNSGPAQSRSAYVHTVLVLIQKCVMLWLGLVICHVDILYYYYFKFLFHSRILRKIFPEFSFLYLSCDCCGLSI